MVRLRSAAAFAAACSAPQQARHLVRILCLAVLVTVAGCSAAAVRSEPSNLGEHPSSALATSGGSPAGRATSAASKPRAGTVAIERAWTASKTAFYRAALAGEPRYPPLLATLVSGGPVYLHSIAYLTALASAGVRGPPTWRIGRARVVSLGARRGRVEGCLFDTGSVWLASGAPAPASLGGGAGLTASDATLVLAGGRWRVLTDDVRAVSSAKEPGPCHGF